MAGASYFPFPYSDLWHAFTQFFGAGFVPWRGLFGACLGGLVGVRRVREGLVGKVSGHPAPPCAIFQMYSASAQDSVSPVGA